VLEELRFLTGYAQRVGSKLESTHARLGRVREQLNLTQEELQLTDRMLSGLFDYSSDAVIMADLHGAVLLTKPSLKELAGISENQSVLNLSDLFPAARCSGLLKMVPEGTRQGHVMAFEEALVSSNVQVGSCSIV